MAGSEEMKHLPAILVSTLLLSASSSAAPIPPVMLLQSGDTKDPGAAGGSRTAFALMRLPDGGFAFYNRYSPTAEPLTLPDATGRPHRLLPPPPARIVTSDTIRSSGVLNNAQVILTERDEVMGVTVRGETLDRQGAERVGLPRYLNTWFQRASLREAGDPLMTWRGYNGSQMEYQRLRAGRLLVPHGSMVPHARALPPFGRHETIVQYSDDDGVTWRVSGSRLVAPCHPGFNGSSEGACEPAFEELADGRIWMLMRTAAGFLYESFSADRGTTWSAARASRFNTSTGPANLMRHRNGWLVLCWNNCELPPRHEGQGVYGGRDALHIAVSADEGRTWRGFREIYLDPRRNDNPAKSGDRGTAYPLGAYTADGKIVVLAGQGAGGRNPILINPEWIVATNASTDFSDGLKQWSTYLHQGPAKRWWRARTAGAILVPHPSDPQRKCLLMRHQADLPADGATWNFPNGWRGALTARVRLTDGFRGGTISLNDRFFDPANDLGETFGVFQVMIGADRSLGRLKLPIDKWITLRLEWNLDTGACLVSANDRVATRLKLRHPTLNGVSYVRLRSTTAEPDADGYLVENVSVSIADPYAPSHSATDQLAHEQRYTAAMVPLWSRP